MQDILEPIMLRRTKVDFVNGKPLLELPAKKFHEEVCDFSEDERRFYDSLNDTVTDTFNFLLEEGGQEEVMRNYIQILALLMFLREGLSSTTLNECFSETQLVPSQLAVI